MIGWSVVCVFVVIVVVVLFVEWVKMECLC